MSVFILLSRENVGDANKAQICTRFKLPRKTNNDRKPLYPMTKNTIKAKIEQRYSNYDRFKIRVFYFSTRLSTAFHNKVARKLLIK